MNLIHIQSLVYIFGGEQQTYRQKPIVMNDRQIIQFNGSTKEREDKGKKKKELKIE